jgi:hypothetical protein
MTCINFALSVGFTLFIQFALATNATAASLPTDNADAADRAALSKLASDSYKAAVAEYQAGTAHNPEEMVYIWSKRWMEADIKMETSLAAKLEAAKAHLDRMHELARQNRGAQLGLGGHPAPLANTQYYEAEAQLISDRMRRSLKSGEK